MDLRISELLAMQRELQELHKGDWADVVPSTARDHLLWGVGEIGEVIDIIKKRGDGEIMDNPETRRHFIEEMADVQMYLLDVLLCYGGTIIRIPLLSQCFFESYDLQLTCIGCN